MQTRRGPGTVTFGALGGVLRLVALRARALVVAVPALVAGRRVAPSAAAAHDREGHDRGDDDEEHHDEDLGVLHCW
jgi:hypothetical protein